jgi:putative membrane protein
MELTMAKQAISEGFILFIKGVFMGAADIIPGVSGGTIAFITGIYERFINALKSLNIHFILYSLIGLKNKDYKEKAKQSFSQMDLTFLLLLAAGIALAFLSLANIVGFLLEEFPTYTYGFFLGLILSSAAFVYFSHKKTFNHWSFLVFVVIGSIVGYGIVGIESIQMQHSIIIIFFSGLISFCAMILPGLSGAFILLLLGQYEFMLGVLRQITRFDFGSLPFAFSYLLGGILGLVIFSRVLSYLIKRYRMATISFILGLMIGALRKPGELIIKDPQQPIFTVIAIILGILLVCMFSYYDFKLKKRNPTIKNAT